MTSLKRTNSPDPTQRKRILKKKKRGIALGVALTFVATPAFASIIIQNFMAADITANPACFTKVAGDDVANSTLVTFDGAATDPVDGANLIQEKITLQGQIGDRVIFTDVVTYQNNCAEALDVQLIAPEVVGAAFADISAQIWLSKVAAPADVDPNTEATLTPAVDDWEDDNITVPAGTAAGALADTSGVVQVPAGQSIQGAFVVSAGTAFTGTASLEWIAQATVVP